VLMLPDGPQTIRAATHLDVTAADVDRAIEAMREVVKQR